MEAYGPNSAFALFHKTNGTIISIGLDFNSTFSMHHYIEYNVGCDYRRIKEFSGIYMGYDRVPRIKTYSMFVRKDERVKTYIVPGMNELLAAGVIKEVQVGAAKVHLPPRMISSITCLSSCASIRRNCITLKSRNIKLVGAVISRSTLIGYSTTDMVNNMKPYTSLKSILAEFFPLHRTLASDDHDKTLEIIGSYMPDSSNYTIETYAPLTPVWTWKVPERYVVHEAYLEIEGGERVVDFKDNPLHIVSYSLPVDKTLSFEELQPHLYFNEKRPHAIPWVFKYYERDWGFCLPKNIFDKLPRDKKYHAVIKSEFITDPKQGFKVATAVVHPEGGPNPAAGEFLVQAHTCHPMQANDDGAGVVSTIELARRLAEKPLPAGSMSVRFWFGPETIGTIAWLAHNEQLIPNLRGGIFMEMTGNQNKIAWHHTRQHNHLLDRITNHVITQCRSRRA